MKHVLGVMAVVVGVSSLAGCTQEVSDAQGEDSISSQADAVLVTPSALSKGTRRDYDGDGKEDVMFMDADFGTFQVLGKSPGGFNQSAGTYVNSQMNGSNTYLQAGDFNKDGRTDLLVTTTSGTAEWTGKAGGGFNYNVWSSSTLKLISGSGPNFDATIGDFNGDGFTDFIATTSAGSYLYTGKATGFNANVWSNTTAAFRRGNVTFTAGNFDSNATTDFIATTATASTLYLGSTGTGGFGAGGWSSTALRNDVYPNVTRFIVGNFNGVGADDFIVQTGAGAFLYTSAAGSMFTQHAWSAPALEITGSKLAPGDFNGDGCWDFLYQDGSALRIRTYKQGTPAVPGTFNAAVLVDTRFPVFYDSSIRTGDFTGDGRDDFIIQTRPTTGNGSYEFTGTSAATGGFNKDVWTSTMFWQNSAF